VDRATNGDGGFVLTPNVDHIAIAQRSPAFVDAYRRTFLSLPDGMPMIMLCRLLRLPVRTKVSGSDLFEPLMARCARERLPIFFLGSTADSCQRAIQLLKERHPGIDITGYDDSFFDPDLDSGAALRAFHRARASGARIIMCNLPPVKQVLLSQYMWEYSPAVGVATGGALGFFVGDERRAPTWVSQSGFEWLYRLVQSPRRLWRRYLVDDLAAFPVFLGMLLRRLAGQPLCEPATVTPVLRRRLLLRRVAETTPPASPEQIAVAG
jgi:N-acetylglucosaminyldiphosphoundecaprenol N-acetyl-beta-D-mannosaminyltransferase